MKIFVDFDCLLTLDCVYGEWFLENGVAKIFVEKGLALKKSRFVACGLEGSIVECDGEGGAEKIFPVHYIYDPAKDVEYTNWELLGGYLRAYNREKGWVEYESKADSLYAMHEYVGGCWLVFAGVMYFKKLVSEYTLDRKSFTGARFSEEFGACSVLSEGNKYLLEGVSNYEPRPGWVSMEVHAESMFIEIPDG